MSFQEKSNLVMTVITALVYGVYFAKVMPPALSEGPSMDLVMPYLFAAVVFLVVGGVVAHILVAVAAPNEPDMSDERDTLIEMRADARSGYVMSAAAVLSLGLALMGQHLFWIVHMILGGLVAAELVKGVLRAIDYRLGG